MNKADVGITAIALDLTKQGFVVCTPLSEHAWFDLVAVKGDQTYTIQCKYRDSSGGVMKVGRKNYRNDGEGNKGIDHLPIDYYAVTDGSNVAYVPYNQVALLTGSFAVRITPPANNQRSGVRLIEDYQSLGT